MRPAIEHTACGTHIELRWVLDDYGDDVIVCWCPACDGALPFTELSRPVEATDVPVAMVLQATTLTRVQ